MDQFRALRSDCWRGLWWSSSCRRAARTCPSRWWSPPGGATRSDAELARALMAGSAWAITETWHRFAPGVVMLARRALGSECEAEDVAQEVFQRVFAKAKTLREPERLRSFVFSFAIRVLKTELRRKRARAWLSFHRPETLVDLGGELADMESRDLSAPVLCVARSSVAAASPGLRASSPRVHDGGGGRRHMELSLSTVKRALERATSKLSLWIEADPGLAGFLDDEGWRR